MERMAVHVVRILGRLSDTLANMVLYIGLLGLSLYATVALIYIPPITKLLTFISDFGSLFIILIIYATVFLIFMICCSFYAYIKFIKYPIKILLRVGFGFLTVTAAVYVLKQLDGCEVGYSLSELFEYIHSFLLVLWLALLMLGVLIFLSSFREWIYGHKINTHFKFACSALKRLEKIQDNEMNNYKDLHTIHSVSVEYACGIREIKNLLIRGIDPNRFFDSNTELSLNEILDWLVFSMQYYLFYGGYEQLEAAKEHLKCMAINFDEEYHIDTDQFMHEILRRYNEINTYFKENNIYIARSIKFTDRVMGYLPQALLAIALLVISIITKNFIIN